MNNKGQLSAEYMLLIGVMVLVLLISTSMIIDQSEKNTIITSAQVGIQTGIDKNAYAMYYNDTFNRYQESYPELLTPTEIDVVKIDSNTNDKKMELQITLHTSKSLTSYEQYVIGSRVNYYTRRCISEAFNKTGNTYYDPAYSDNYEITTKDVKWV